MFTPYLSSVLLPTLGEGGGLGRSSSGAALPQPSVVMDLDLPGTPSSADTISSEDSDAAPLPPRKVGEGVPGGAAEDKVLEELLEEDPDIAARFAGLDTRWASLNPTAALADEGGRAGTWDSPPPERRRPAALQDAHQVQWVVKCSVPSYAPKNII